MSDLLIRPVQPADIATIHAIYSYHVVYGTASWELTAPDEAEMRRRVQSVLDNGFPYVVGEIDGRVVGYSYASSYRPRPGYRFTVEDSIYVDEPYQRRGIARKLLSTVIDRCVEQGFRQMIGIIGDSANIASIELHRSLGFTHMTTLPAIGFKFGRWLDSVMMQKTLGEGGTNLPTVEPLAR